MPQYLSPGVYVEEVPSAVKAIAGVSTSTAGFVGIVPDSITVPVSSSLVTNEKVGTANGTATDFNLQRYPVVTTAGAYEVRVNGAPVAAQLANDDPNKVARVTLTSAPAAGAVISGDFVYEYTTATVAPAAAGVPRLCTTFSDFKKSFGDFSLDAGQRALAHAVYGFFNNGGSRCYVVRVTADTQIRAALE
jgi:phage tail sheath protein FI